MKIGTGVTTKQMQAAPQGAVFVWCNRHTDYPKALARKIGRHDLDIRPLAWLRPENVRGREFVGVVLDHAAKLDSDGYEAMSWVHLRMRSNCEVSGLSAAGREGRAQP